MAHRGWRGRFRQNRSRKTLPPEVSLQISCVLYPFQRCHWIRYYSPFTYPLSKQKLTTQQIHFSINLVIVTLTKISFSILSLKYSRDFLFLPTEDKDSCNEERVFTFQNSNNWIIDTPQGSPSTEDFSTLATHLCIQVSVSLEDQQVQKDIAPSRDQFELEHVAHNDPVSITTQSHFIHNYIVQNVWARTIYWVFAILGLSFLYRLFLYMGIRRNSYQIIKRVYPHDVSAVEQDIPKTRMQETSMTLEAWIYCSSWFESSYISQFLCLWLICNILSKFAVTMTSSLLLNSISCIHNLQAKVLFKIVWNVSVQMSIKSLFSCFEVFLQNIRDG